MLKNLNKTLAVFVLSVLVLILCAEYVQTGLPARRNHNLASIHKGWVLEETGQAADLSKPIKTGGHQLALRRKVNHLMAYQGAVVLFTKDQSVEVFLNGQRVYSSVPKNRFYNISSDEVWHYIHLPNAQAGDDLRLVLKNDHCSLVQRYGRTYPVSSSYSFLDREYRDHKQDYFKVHHVYVGSYQEYMNFMVIRSMVPIFMSFVVLLMGFVMMGFALYVNYKECMKDSRYLLYFGLCNIFAGIYLVLSNHLTNPAFGSIYLVNEVRNLSILLATLSIGLCMAVGVEEKWHQAGSATAVGMGILLGIRGLAYVHSPLKAFAMMLSTDLYFYAALLLAGMVACLYGKESKIRSNNWTFFMVVTGIAAMDYLLMAICGIHVYYHRMLALLVYFGGGMVREMSVYLELYEKAKGKEYFKALAGTDDATGLKNRLTLKDKLVLYNKRIEDISAVVLDVNNLKAVNDTLGHSAGDALIQECANLIRENFEDLGDCYRLGGDEFLVVLHGVPKSLVLKRLNQLALEMKKDRPGAACKKSMAIGTASYEPYYDRDVEDIIRRADKLMYQEKKKEKQLEARALAF